MRKMGRQEGATPRACYSSSSGRCLWAARPLLSLAGLPTHLNFSVIFVEQKAIENRNFVVGHAPSVQQLRSIKGQGAASGSREDGSNPALRPSKRLSLPLVYDATQHLHPPAPVQQPARLPSQGLLACTKPANPSLRPRALGCGPQCPAPLPLGLHSWSPSPARRPLAGWPPAA